MRQNQVLTFLLMTLFWFGGVLAQEAAQQALSPQQEQEWRQSVRKVTIANIVSKESNPKLRQYINTVLVGEPKGLLSAQDKTVLRESLVVLGGELKIILSTLGTSTQDVIKNHRDKVIPPLFKLGIILIDLVRLDTDSLPLHLMLLGSDVTLLVLSVSPEISKTWNTLKVHFQRAMSSLGEAFCRIANIVVEEVKNKVREYKDRVFKWLKINQSNA